MFIKEKYIDPFTDYGFKKLFGSEPNKDLLIDFLNQVILPQRHRITDLSYKSSEFLGKTENDRRAIFDIYCISENGERFIVEMQKAKQNYFKDRSVFYSTFPIQEQAQQGEWTFQLSAVYTVGILDFIFNNDIGEREIRHEVKLKNQKNEIFYDKLTFIYLEMPNFNKTEEELETTYDKWLYLLKNLHRLEKRPKKLQEKIFEKVFKIAEIAKFTPKERAMYEESLKNYRDWNNTISTAMSDGKKEGMEIGREIGMEMGMEMGIKEEKQNNILSTLKSGKLSLEDISVIFGVGTEYILELKSKHNL